MYPSLWKISNFSTAWVKCHVVAVKCLLICVVHYCVDYIFWSQMRAAYCLVASASSKDPRSGIFATCQNQAVPPCMYIHNKILTQPSCLGSLPLAKAKLYLPACTYQDLNSALSPNKGSCSILCIIYTSRDTNDSIYM